MKEATRDNDWPLPQSQSTTSTAVYQPNLPRGEQHWKDTRYATASGRTTRDYPQPQPLDNKLEILFKHSFTPFRVLIKVSHSVTIFTSVLF